MRMMRCTAQLSIAVTGKPTEHFWPGLDVDFARELSPGFTVADAITGREDCFEDVTDHEAPPPAAKRVSFDIEGQWYPSGTPSMVPTMAPKSTIPVPDVVEE